MMTKRITLRSTGRFLFVSGLAALAVLLPALGWTARNDVEAFNKQVGWANIWAGSIGAVGLLMMVLGKKQDHDVELNRQVILLAKAQQISHGRQLAQLLGTDALESRSAKLKFCAADARTGKSAPNARTAGNIDTIAAYYKRTPSGRMLILGAPGAGKTVAGITLLLQLIADVVDSQNAEKSLRVPVIFNLTTWASSKRFENWLADELSMRFRLSPSISRQLIQDGRILPLLDGLDEMDNELESPDRAERAVQQLNDYIAVNSRAPLIVITRSGSQYYSRLRGRFRNTQAVLIKPFHSTDIDGYIAEHCGQGVVDEIKRGLSKGPRKARGMFYSETSTPWRLAMMVGYVHSGNDPARLLPTSPEGQAEFESRLNSELYETFLSTRFRLGGCKDDHEVARARHMLSRIAHFLHSGKGDEQASDIVLHDWWRRFGGRVPAWQLRAAAMAVILPFALPLDSLPLTDYVPNANAGWTSWAMPLSNFLMLMAMALATPFQLTSPRGINFARLLSSAGLLRATLLAIPCAGVGYWFSTITSHDALGVGAALGLFILLVPVIGNRIEATEDAMNPHEPLRRDFAASSMFGLGMGLFMGTYIAETMGSKAGICFGLGYFLSLTLGFSSGRYFVATLLGPTVGLPRRLSLYLRWATNAGVLRVSGINYQFRHRELMNYLLATSEPPGQMPVPGPFGIPMQRWPKWIERRVEA
ncbi:NACHT domain-containing protein [Micromonospora foliorum]|uniref:NACHT domain-containing protein n=1 Tax=Micromonospora foliorum TaxID=2911210 RepID=UPI001EE96866|nr:NACHT domain-containing protein [Micromonospora foliorum]MCG5440301.1 NACHT domain-containing protein [Micromonospora foliorum]